ncbi:BTB/POZ domain-containing protein 19 isoform X2 [Mauremys mutica]|uniref:BTB/POZ domain-containing protein 19 isoform X2 n=1 Tax=Mauremys mutica TaxID=74926 RepID=UPI001D162B23|nr:BTB/POZ domain-containing protein 19 isoform X2 [Mauremys mutica]
MACAGSAVLEGDTAAFAAAVRSLINNPQFSDVTFVVGRERQEVFAHRCILACRCQAFQGMLSQPQAGAQEPWPPQTPLVLSHVQPEVFLAVLEFLYTNSVTLNSLTALEVLTSAVEYGLDDLRKAAVTYGQTELQEHCLVFVEDRTQEVVQTRSFHELSAAALVAVLRSDRLAIDEPDLIRAVREWAHVSSVSAGSPHGQELGPTKPGACCRHLSPHHGGHPVSAWHSWEWTPPTLTRRPHSSPRTGREPRRPGCQIPPRAGVRTQASWLPARASSRHQRSKQVPGVANGEGQHIRLFGGNSGAGPSILLRGKNQPPNSAK